MKIDNYSFGSMKVDGKVYRKDLIVFPDTVKPEWWRKDGHSLATEDLKGVLDYKPEVLVVGMGAFGFMKIPESTRAALKERNIELVGKNTGEAYKIFNEQIQRGKKVVGVFHLTC